MFALSLPLGLLSPQQGGVVQSMLGREGQTMRDVTQPTRVAGRGFLALAGVKKPCSNVAAALLDSLAVVIC